MINIFRKKLEIRRDSNLFISIGAGFNQLPLIREAKSLGYHIIGIDKNTNSAGIIESDIRIQESVDNYEEIFVKLQELLLAGKVKGVLSRSYGSAIKTASFIADKLGIKYIPFNRVDELIDKKKMKTSLKNNGLPMIPSATIKSSAKTPVIFKPAVGHAKSGIKYFEKSADLAKYLKTNKIKNTDDYILEHYIDGDEIIAVGIIADKKFYLVEITDKVTTGIPYFVDKMHVSPSKYYDKWEEISDIGQKISDTFEIINSPIVIEFKVDNSNGNKLYIIETAAEFGGEFLCDKLIPLVTGYNIIRQSILAMTTGEFTPPIPKPQKSAGVVKYIMPEDGEFIYFKPKAPDSIPCVIYSRIFKEIGSKIQSPVTNHDRLGVVVVKSRTPENAIEIANNAINELQIKIK